MSQKTFYFPWSNLLSADYNLQHLRCCRLRYTYPRKSQCFIV